MKCACILSHAYEATDMPICSFLYPYSDSLITALKHLYSIFTQMHNHLLRFLTFLLYNLCLHMMHASSLLCRIHAKKRGEVWLNTSLNGYCVISLYLGAALYSPFPLSRSMSHMLPSVSSMFMGTCLSVTVESRPGLLLQLPPGL